MTVTEPGRVEKINTALQCRSDRQYIRGINLQTILEQTVSQCTVAWLQIQYRKKRSPPLSLSLISVSLCFFWARYLQRQRGFLYRKVAAIWPMTCCVPWPIPAESTPEASATLLRWQSDLHSRSSHAVNVRCECPFSKRVMSGRYPSFKLTWYIWSKHQGFFLFITISFILGIINIFLCMISPEGVPSWKHVHIWPSLPSNGTPHRSMDINSGAVTQTSSSSQIPCCQYQQPQLLTVATSAGFNWPSLELNTGF